MTGDDQIRQSERQSIASILEAAAKLPTTNADRAACFNEIAEMLRKPHEELITIALRSIVEDLVRPRASLPPVKGRK